MSNTLGFDNFQKLGKSNVDVALQTADAVARGMRAVAEETSDYSRRSFEAATAAFTKLTSAKSLDTAVAVQSDFAREAYEGYVGQVAKLGEIVADMAKGASKPFEALFTAYGK